MERDRRLSHERPAGQAFRPSWLVAGALAGLACGRFTVWSRERRGGDESFLDGLATFYLGIVVYWAGFVVIERAAMCIERRGWTDFDLRDHLVLIGWLVLEGTLRYGVLLIPLAFLSRLAVWKVYRAVMNAGAPSDPGNAARPA